MQLASGSCIPDGLLVANALLSEKLHQGSATYSGTLHQGLGVVISSTSLGIIGSLYDGDVRSRCTGKERDSESGLDYFGARHYASGLGRFMIADWKAKPTSVPFADFGDPQSLNLYSYVRNTPTSLYDPDGHCWRWLLNCDTAKVTVTNSSILGVVTVSTSSTTLIKDNDGNVLGWTTTTKTASFSTEGPMAGTYLGTVTETTTMPGMLGNGPVQYESSSSTTHDLKEAVQTFGGNNIMTAQRMAGSYIYGVSDYSTSWSWKDTGHTAAAVGLGALGVGCAIGEPCGVIAGITAAAGVVEGVSAVNDAGNEGSH